MIFDESTSSIFVNRDLVKPETIIDEESSVSERLVSKASSFRAQLEHGLKEAIYNMFSWVRDQPDRDLDGLMEEIDHLSVHSDGSL